MAPSADQLTHEAERVEAVHMFGARRWPLQPLSLAAWAPTDRIAVRDALYVALALSLDATLITTDERLRRGASGIVNIAEPDECE